jgi:hypothetical protein
MEFTLLGIERQIASLINENGLLNHAGLILICSVACNPQANNAVGIAIFNRFTNVD